MNMTKLFPPTDSFEKRMNDIKQKIDDYYKQYFGSGNGKDYKFTMHIKSNLTKNHSFYDSLDIVFKFDIFESMVSGYQNLDLEIIKNIFMIHKEHTEELNNDEKKLKCKDQKYIDEIIIQTKNQLMIRNYATLIIRKEVYDSFRPSIYSLWALIMYTKEVLEKNISNIKINNRDFFNTMMNKIIKKIIACLTLLDNNLIEESFPMLRTISEMLLIYKVLSNQKQSVIDTYSKHVKWSFEYNETNEFPVEIRNKENRIDYLNFGWLDDIVEYEYAISKKYKLSDVSDLIISENLKRKGMGDTLFKIYKLCNPLSHGSNNEINETYSRKLLIDNLGIIVLDISSKIKSLTNNDFILNDVDLIKYFTECHKLNSIKLKRS